MASNKRSSWPSNARRTKGAARTIAELAPPHESDQAAMTSTADQIVLAVVRGLYEGSYVPGQKLIEPDLMRQYGVARSTVREALRRLAAEGLVTLSLYRGARIRSLTRHNVRDMLEVLAALAGLAARLAAERIASKEDEKLLRNALSRLSTLAEADAPFEFARQRNRLYRQLAQISGNAELARLVPLLQTNLIRVQFPNAYTSGSEKKMLQDYSTIIGAVLKHDGDRAERAIRNHIRDTAEAIEKLPDHQFAQET